MADIRNINNFNNARWNWDRAGYSKAFSGGISPSDVDVIVERNGQFLVIETKEADDTDSHPFYMPVGQSIMYRALARLPEFDVYYLSGVAETGDPHYLRKIGPSFADDKERDWRHVSKQERRDLLFQLLSGWFKKANNSELQRRGVA
jgi:hypothetical protein